MRTEEHIILNWRYRHIAERYRLRGLAMLRRYGRLALYNPNLYRGKPVRLPGNGFTIWTLHR